ncbi:retinol-binding protein 5 isoform X1 [Mastacembelus armatus]|uniref:retinol-binding protein 5 isoform X1 n=1 Tax=Mastacembelus armatus TaxID=205130 RepID=UPI000E45A4B8|nr:retinol-binding protein 1-like isoform X1 [Mastacembelus armatus]
MSKPNYSGTFHMVEQENMDAYLAALDINFALRKIVCLLKPTKEITHDPATGAMKIRTLTTLKNFNMDFAIGKEFTEDLGPVDGRTCQTTVDWEGDKLVCVQRGEKEGRGWTHWLEGDKLHLVRMYVWGQKMRVKRPKQRETWGRTGNKENRSRKGKQSLH